MGEKKPCRRMPGTARLKLGMTRLLVSPPGSGYGKAFVRKPVGLRSSIVMSVRFRFIFFKVFPQNRAASTFLKKLTRSVRLHRHTSFVQGSTMPMRATQVLLDPGTRRGWHAASPMERRGVRLIAKSALCCVTLPVCSGLLQAVQGEAASSSRTAIKFFSHFSPCPTLSKFIPRGRSGGIFH
jgi:hypothetical protein